MIALAILAIALFAALLLVPVGLPGLWVMVGVALLYDLLGGVAGEGSGMGVGIGAIIGVTVLAAAAEVVELILGGRMARRYGGSRRAEWGAMIGGIAGALVGVPVPVLGPMIGAFGGAFIGALVAELSLRRGARAAGRAATGALVGRALAVMVKMGVGALMATWLLLAAWR